MRVLALDLASTTGYAVLEGNDAVQSLVTHGVIARDRAISFYGVYPWSYLGVTEDSALAIIELVLAQKPDRIVVEETNQTKGSRYAQKYLEFLHRAVLQKIWECGLYEDPRTAVAYISTGEWKKALRIKLSKDQAKANRKLKQLKDVSKDPEVLRAAKKAAGIRGKVTSKHLSVQYVNTHWGMSLKQQDDDVADAICLGEAYLKGAKLCDGT